MLLPTDAQERVAQGVGFLVTSSYAPYVAAAGAAWTVVGASLWLLFEPMMAHAIGAPVAYEDEE